jgi:hypothetical protein
MLFVRMLTIILKRMSRSIQTKEACPPVITAASPVTSNPNVHSSEVEGSEEAANKSYIRHSTSDGTLGSTASTEVCSCQSEWQTKEEQSKALQEKAAEVQ